MKTKTLTFNERATWGDCPDCGAKDGQWCRADTAGIVYTAFGQAVKVGEFAHTKRITASPERVRLVPIKMNDWQPMHTAPKTGAKIRALIPRRGEDNAVAWDGEAWLAPGEHEPVQPAAWTRWIDIEALPNGLRIQPIVWDSLVRRQAWIDAEAITTNPDHWPCDQAAAVASAAIEICNRERIEHWRLLELRRHPPAAQGALMALLAWDDCGELLYLSVEALWEMVWDGDCLAHYKALLIAPAVIAMDRTKRG